MSVSQNNNMTKAERRAAEAAKQAQEQKKTRRITIACLAGLAVIIVFVAIFGSDLFYSGTTSLNVNGFEFTAADYNFFYVAQYNAYRQGIVDQVGSEAAANFLPTTRQPLEDQIFTGETTWDDFLEERALAVMETYTSLYNEAKANGFELTEESRQAIEDERSTLGSNVELLGYSSVNDYLKMAYGKGMDEERYFKNREFMAYAVDYSEYVSSSFEYTQEELDTEYNDNVGDIEDYLYYYSMIVHADKAETQEELDANMENAKADADALAGLIYDTESFSSTAMSYVMQNVEDYDDQFAYTSKGAKAADVPEEIKEWLLDDSREMYDVAVLPTGGNLGDPVNGYTLVLYIARDVNDHKSINGYYLDVFVRQVNEDDFETKEEYEADVASAIADAEEMAQEIVDEWNSGVFTEFTDLASKYAIEINGGSRLSQIGKNVTSVAAIDDWFFNEPRTEGDIEILTLDDKVYIVKFDSYDDLYRDVLADANLRETDYTTWEDSIVEGSTTETYWSYRFAGQGLLIGENK